MEEHIFDRWNEKKKFQCALLAQVRYLDAKRLKYKQSNLSKQAFIKLREALIVLIKK